MDQTRKLLAGKARQAGVLLLILCVCMMAYLALSRHGHADHASDRLGLSRPHALTSAAPSGSATQEAALNGDGLPQVEPDMPRSDARALGVSNGGSEDPTPLERLEPISTSNLSVEEQARAISSFEAQRESWLAIRTGSARFETCFRLIKAGQLVAQEEAPPQTGLIQFLVEPAPGDKMGDLSPARVKAHMFNDRGWNFVRENVFDGTEKPKEWAAYEYCPLQGDMARLAREAFSTELLFFPFDFMAKTFQDDVWHNKYTAETKEAFFADRGIPWRRSTAEEESRLFRNEPQYLFMASPGMSDAHYWLSAENGDLRRIEVFLPGNVVKSFQYEDYYQYPDHKEKYPRQLTMTWVKGEGASATGWEFTMRLTNVALNIDIPAGDFLPPGGPSSP
jgi:hypothetical protein